MEKSVFFVRHGESLANIGVATSSPASVPLTKKGHKQAHTVAQYFSKQPGLIIHSPYFRTFETATPLIKHFPKTKVEIWPIYEFTYLDTKVNAGTTSVERKKNVDAYWSKLDPSYIDGYGAESFSNMISRVRECLWRIETHESSKIVVFCHGQIMHTLSLISRFPDAQDVVIMELCREERKAWFSPKNTEVWETGITKDKKWLPLETKFIPEE